MYVWVPTDFCFSFNTMLSVLHRYEFHGRLAERCMADEINIVLASVGVVQRVIKV